MGDLEWIKLAWGQHPTGSCLLGRVVVLARSPTALFPGDGSGHALEILGMALREKLAMQVLQAQRGLGS